MLFCGAHCATLQVTLLLVTPTEAIKAWEMDTLNAAEMAREAQIKLAGQRNIRMEEVVADYLQSLRELGLPEPVPAGTAFNSPDHATCPRDARGCASDAAIRKWFELAGVLPDGSEDDLVNGFFSGASASPSSSEGGGGGGGGGARINPAAASKKGKKRGDGGKKKAAAAAGDGADGDGVAGTNLVAYNRIPRSMSLEAIHAYLKAVAMEAPEKLTPDVLKLVVADLPREAMETRRYTVAETLEDIKARITRIGEDEDDGGF